jgi:hypothetical protein
MQDIEEECKHYLHTYVSDLSDEQAKRRGASICSAFQKMLTVGHEHCQHPNIVQVLSVPIGQLTNVMETLRVPEPLKKELVLRVFMDASDGFIVAITKVEAEVGVPGMSLAMGITPPRKSNFEEIILNGIKPQQLIEGFLRVIHQTSVVGMATQPPAMA